MRLTKSIPPNWKLVAFLLHRPGENHLLCQTQYVQSWRISIFCYSEGRDSSSGFFFWSASSILWDWQFPLVPSSHLKNSPLISNFTSCLRQEWIEIGLWTCLYLVLLINTFAFCLICPTFIIWLLRLICLPYNLSSSSSFWKSSFLDTPRLSWTGQLQHGVRAE